MKRLLELRPVLQFILEYIQWSVGIEEFSDIKIARPTGEMWFHIQCLGKLLVNFDGMTKLLSGEIYATMPLILPSIRLLETRLQNKKILAQIANGHQGEPCYDGSLVRMHLVRRLFLVLLRKRFGNVSDDIKSCCLLDPQFAHGNYLTSAERVSAEQFLVNESMRHAGVEVAEYDPNSSVDVSSKDDDDFTNELLERVKAELKLLFDKCKILEKTKNQTRVREKSKPKNQTKLENPLNWRKSSASDVPLIAPVVRKYFGVVATSVPSERCFSCAGNTITARRNKLTGENVRDIIFLHNSSVDEVDEVPSNG
ncbi:Zinc finger protein [Phytophthora palmivora]|uniref:Zinc finger protein n=1 Tax=Phytophthora palmivora TaxID=4796 RepID=A0A2P4XS07_9STRA|nr:Zinc finger protein [Phytophthora palmivora]